MRCEPIIHKIIMRTLIRTYTVRLYGYLWQRYGLHLFHAGKQDDYDHLQYAPVLSIKVNVEADSIVKIGKLIEQSIFKNNDQSIYEIVP